jgi:hypothetical protein
MPKQAGFYGKHFNATHGVQQGDIMSPSRKNRSNDKGGEVSRPISQESYHYRIAGHGRSWKDGSKDKLPCGLCGSIISQ